MTLSRPVAIGLLVAIVVLLGCLMLSQGGGEDTTPAGATPGLQQPSGTDRPFATLEDSAEEQRGHTIDRADPGDGQEETTETWDQG